MNRRNTIEDLRFKIQDLRIRLSAAAILLLILNLKSFIGFSQAYENSWINYGQDYYKIKVWNDGIYRISSSGFTSASIDISNWDITKIQIYHNGTEQYIYIYDSDHNGKIDNSSDYIEFYGQRNDGTFDTQ